MTSPPSSLLTLQTDVLVIRIGLAGTWAATAGAGPWRVPPEPQRPVLAHGTHHRPCPHHSYSR